MSIPTDVVLDVVLDLTAVGLLARLMSHPAGEVGTLLHGDLTILTRAALSDLQEAGYIQQDTAGQWQVIRDGEQQ